jgi:DNA-binding XRE family transcriptional regulator
MTDRQRHGLPTNVIKAIRKLIDQGETQQSIAVKYGVSRETISAIATRRVYSHVEEGDTPTGQDPS